MSSTYLLTKVLQERATLRTWIGYGIVTLLMAYCHVFAVVVIASQLVYAVLSERPARPGRAGPLLRLVLFWSLVYLPPFLAFVSRWDVGQPADTGGALAATLTNLLWLYDRLLLDTAATTLTLALAIALGALGAMSALRARPTRAAGGFLSLLA